jgi:hypothetical protein
MIYQLARHLPRRWLLNRADWLAKMGYTIAQALERIGSEWAGMIPAAAQIIHTTNETLAQANASATTETTLANCVVSEGEVDLTADLVTYAHAPGYRDARLIFDVRRPGASTSIVWAFKSMQKTARRGPCKPLRCIGWRGMAKIQLTCSREKRAHVGWTGMRSLQLNESSHRHPKC